MGGQSSTETAPEGDGAGQAATATESNSEMKAIFDKLDTDKSGTLDKSEITDALKEMGKSGQYIQKFLAGMEKDCLNFDEFQIAAAEVTSPKHTKAVPSADVKTDPEQSTAVAAEITPETNTEEERKTDMKTEPDKPVVVAPACVSEVEPKVVGTRQKKAKAAVLAKPSESRPEDKGVRLYVANVDSAVTEAGLRQVFEQCGPVLSVYVKIKQGTHGFAFVCVPQEIVDNAIGKVNGLPLQGRVLQVRLADTDKATAMARISGKGKDKGNGKGKDGKGQSKDVKSGDVKGKDSKGKGVGDMGQKSKGKGKWTDGKGHEGKGIANIENGPVVPSPLPRPPVLPGLHPVATNPYASLANAQFAQNPIAGYPGYGYGYPGYGFTNYALPYNPYPGVTQTDIAALLGPKVYEGSLKSIRPSGFGFILCVEAYSQYKRDVYVDKADIPVGATVGSRVQFTISLSDKGHPRADKLRLIPLS